MRRPLRIQLWSYNYDPEPTGIGPVSTTFAKALDARGHTVEVVAAHPHYPEPRWGRRHRPYRETRDGIDVLRLPLWIGRDSSAQRIRQELTYMLAQSAALPALSSPDVLVAVSPSFPALVPAILHSRLRRTPWILWLQDIIPDAATVTGLLDPGPLLKGASRLESLAYREADHITVLSGSFVTSLLAKGVPEEKITVIHNPATRTPQRLNSRNGGGGPFRILSMGNIGYSQGLAPLVAAFERSPQVAGSGVELIITGSGVAAERARGEIRSDRVKMLGLVSSERLEEELQSADLALVSQDPQRATFNLPSKLPNFMAYGVPIIAAVNPEGEVAKIVTAARAGWVTDSAEPDSFPKVAREALQDPVELRRRADNARRFAEGHFSVESFTQRFEELIQTVAARHGRVPSR